MTAKGVQKYSIPEEVIELLQQVQHYLRFRGDIIAMQLHSDIYQLLQKRVYNLEEMQQCMK